MTVCYCIHTVTVTGSPQQAESHQAESHQTESQQAECQQTENDYSVVLGRSKFFLVRNFCIFYELLGHHFKFFIFFVSDDLSIFGLLARHQTENFGKRLFKQFKHFEKNNPTLFVFDNFCIFGLLARHQTENFGKRLFKQFKHFEKNNPTLFVFDNFCIFGLLARHQTENFEDQFLIKFRRNRKNGYLYLP